jgi:GNAT superfamily N-acetyltransferase
MGCKRLVVERLGGCLVELTLPAIDTVRIAQREVTIDDVLAELRRSCAARAGTGTLIDGPGVIGVRSGPAPILWVSAAATSHRVLPELAGSADINEVYVESGATGMVELLAESGWTSSTTSIQIVIESALTLITPSGYTIDAAQARDMPAIRSAMTDAFDLPAAILDSAYPDNFFDVAAPVRVFVARDRSHEIVGTVCVRQQWRSAMVFGLTVRGEHRANGLARALVSTASATALGDGAHFVHGMSSAIPAAAVGGYEIARWTHLVRSDLERTAA